VVVADVVITDVAITEVVISDVAITDVVISDAVASGTGLADLGEWFTAATGSLRPRGLGRMAAGLMVFACGALNMHQQLIEELWFFH
jgi:hypothetical protein